MRYPEPPPFPSSVQPPPPPPPPTPPHPHMPPPQFTSHSHVPPQLYPQEWGNPNCPMPPTIPHSHVPPSLPMPPVIPCSAPRQQSPTPTPTLLPMAGKGDSLAIGINSDTTCFPVSVWQHHRVEIITTDQRNRTTPSHVAFTERLIGDATKDQVTINPVNTIFDVGASIQSDMQL